MDRTPACSARSQRYSAGSHAHRCQGPRIRYERGARDCRRGGSVERGADVLSALRGAGDVPKIRKRQKPCGLWRFPDDLLAQWIMHRPVLPVDEAAGCPASSIFPLRPGCVSRLPLPRSLRAEPASESSGCPLVSGLRRCRRWPFELPRTSHAFGVAGISEAPSFPGGSPLPAAPAMEDPSCPLSCISGFTGDGSPSRPDARIIRRCRLTGPRVAPSPGLSVSPTIRCPSRPER